MFRMKLTEKPKHLYVVACVGFVLGILLNLPVSRLADNLLRSQVGKIPGIQISYESISAGPTLLKGWSYGGIVGMKVHKLSLVLPRSQFEFTCEELVLSPQFVGLLWGALSFSAVCDLDSLDNKKDSSVKVIARIKPFYSLSSLDADIDVSQLFLEKYSQVRALTGLKGVLNGKFSLKNLSLKEIQSEGFSNAQFDWDVLGQDVESPQVTTPVVSMPTIKMGEIKLKGQWQSQQLKIESFKFGKKDGVIEGDLKIDFKFDVTGQPTEGSILGKIRTDSNFEATQLSQTIPMDLYFGKIRESGFREFKKTFNGSFTSLLIMPPEPLN